ncbi:MAG: ribulose-bisphosphate carboxylase large subunit [Candidatus Altiarchaeota archaeon]|nr:ribulose-bisphosphate carboxylase large subunit [Candidatus Altiarchaeota archaeon]
MAYGGYSYIEKYTPQKDDFVTVLWVKGDAPFNTLAEGLAAESSVGTWTKLTTMKDNVWKNLRARVFKTVKITKNSGFVYIAYPYDHFDSKNILQILASIRGNIYGLKEIRELKLLDWKIPEKFQRQFSGPKFSIKEIRKIVGTKKRPHVGTIVKPKVGLSAKEWAKVAENAFLGGLDMVKDDENLVDQKFCRWEDRAHRTIEAAESIKSETGDGKIYVPNITDFMPNMLERIDWLVDHDWRMCMIDVYVMGLTGLKEVIDELHKKKFLIHAHRAGHGAETRGAWGVGYAFWEKIYRLFGVSSLHTGTGVGKMEGSEFEIQKYAEIATATNIKKDSPFFLDFKWHKNIRPIMPVASGGLHSGLMEGLSEIYGTEFTAMAGGGVHGHPEGTIGGARGHRAASEAIGEGVSLYDKAKEVRQLKQALDKWGYVTRKETKKRLAQQKAKFKKNSHKFGYNLDKVVGLH